MQGTLIVIEGTDGSGKLTQCKQLADRLAHEGYEVETFDFPQYNLASSYFVKQYLNGAYGGTNDVGPYTASLFYALDRYEAAPKIHRALEEGKVVLCNRYVGSSMAHQGTKFGHTAERRGYFIWLDNLEFELLKIPRPTRSFVLRVPVEISGQLIDAKEQRTYTDKKRDIHEADTEHLQRSVEVYDDMCQLFPKDFTSIDCTYNGQLLPIDSVHQILWQQVEPLLPAKTMKKLATTTAPSASPKPASIQETAPHEIPYFIPASLPAAINGQYQAHLNRILELHKKITAKLTAYLQASGDAHANARAKQISQAVLPIAMLVTDAHDRVGTLLNGAGNALLKTLVSQQLSSMHAAQIHEGVTLTDVSPRNELAIVPELLYAYSTHPLRELRAQVARWPYEQKAAVFRTFAAQKQYTAFDALHYTWDVVSDFMQLYWLMHDKGSTVQVACQELTPRHGYKIPVPIQEAGLANQFEACYDISLGLYSLLQEAGSHTEAQYATLLGHTVRWKAVIGGGEYLRLAETQASHPLIQQMKEKLAETHPLLHTS